jgi:hypothetical protein
VGFPIGADVDPTKTVFLMFYTEHLCGIGVGFQSGADSHAARLLCGLAECFFSALPVAKEVFEKRKATGSSMPR